MLGKTVLMCQELMIRTYHTKACWRVVTIELGPYTNWLAGSIADVVNRGAGNLQPAELRAGR